MRLGVLDVGSNTVHLLVVDAHRGAPPTPALSEKSVLRLAEHIDDDKLSRVGADALVTAAATAVQSARRLGADDLIGFATSALRGARNSRKVLDRVREEAGIDLQLLAGEDESRLTFLAARRWCGWSAGRLLTMDIGGGSLELASGAEEDPAVAVSVPLGAGRLTRALLQGDPPDKSAVDSLRAYVDETLAVHVDTLLDGGRPDRAVASSKTFRSLARLAGAAPSRRGPYVARTLTLPALRQLISFICRISASSLAELEGVSPARSHQLLAGSVVAESTLRLLDLDEVQICPWALREGVILRRLDWLDGG